MPMNQLQHNIHLEKLNLLIFDLDGTLLNTEKLKFLTYYDELKYNIKIKPEKLKPRFFINNNFGFNYVCRVGTDVVDKLISENIIRVNFIN